MLEHWKMGKKSQMQEALRNKYCILYPLNLEQGKNIENH